MTTPVRILNAVSTASNTIIQQIKTGTDSLINGKKYSLVSNSQQSDVQMTSLNSSNGGTVRGDSQSRRGAQSQFRSSKWDPKLIIAQILAVQSSVYVALFTILFIFRYQLERVFSFEVYGAADLLYLLLLVPLLVSAAILYFVKRPKLCLDFGCTFYVLHIITILIMRRRDDHLNSPWAILYIISCICAVLLSEYLCMRVDIAPIVFNSGARSLQQSRSSDVQQQQSPQQTSSAQLINARGNHLEDNITLTEVVVNQSLRNSSPSSQSPRSKVSK
ncbi:hypothetical protein MP228_002721 [Amoeboaphelidium protococcarum]|nr:hypothetical protein MP228_002721 [Amoeboaphelidium protococcarum]